MNKKTKGSETPRKIFLEMDVDNITDYKEVYLVASLYCCPICQTPHEQLKVKPHVIA